MSERASPEIGAERASPETGAHRASRGTVVIAAERCKGCELCIPACPPRVLRMGEQRNAMGALVPELLPGCTGCGACLLVCPDFCFEVYQYESPGEAR